MIILITGASHTGKTMLAQRMLEKYKYPYLSIDHLKMGLIRSGETALTPLDDDALTAYLWPIVREMIKTAIENGQNLIVEGCYIPFDWRKDFEARYLDSIRFICLAFTEGYIDAHFSEIAAHGSDIEKRLDDADCTAQALKKDNLDFIGGFESAGESVFLIDANYEKTIAECLNPAPKQAEKPFDISLYLEKLVSECGAVFVERLLYVGLQGSFMRGEATENSDIDIMLVLDRLSASDMKDYRAILKRLGSFERSCGFICGRAELSRWNPLEICQLKHTTKDVFGSLLDFLPKFTRQDEINYCKLSLGDLYHALCHGYIHSEAAKNIARLGRMNKPIFFLIQNLHYLESGDFIITKAALSEAVCEADRAMLALDGVLREANFDRAFSDVLLWCQGAFHRLDEMK